VLTRELELSGVERGVFGAWLVLLRMPATCIEAQAATMFRHLERGSSVANMALEALEKLPGDALIRIGAGARVTAFLEHSSEFQEDFERQTWRESKKRAQRILASLSL
jgi:hypothetical protein